LAFAMIQATRAGSQSPLAFVMIQATRAGSQSPLAFVMIQATRAGSQFPVSFAVHVAAVNRSWGTIPNHEGTERDENK
jgi:hypothetical protein